MYIELTKNIISSRHKQIRSGSNKEIAEEKKSVAGGSDLFLFLFLLYIYYKDITIYMILTRLEKEQLVLDLHNQGKGTREIAREVKISFSQIGAILKRAAQQREVGQVQAERTSISTQAYELFSEGRTALQVTIDLKIKADEAIEHQKEYWNLQQLNTLHQVYDAIKDDIWSFVELYKLIKDAGTDQKQVKRLLEIANNDLPRVEELYKNLCREVERLTFEKLSAARDYPGTE